MAKRELIYKDEARRAVLQNAPSVAWCIDSVKPVMVVDDKTAKPQPQTDEYWIARITYWGEEPRIDVVYIYYAWQNGEIDFIPCTGIGADPVRASDCDGFELLEKIDMERYK
jgi:hypothetical protein